MLLLGLILLSSTNCQSTSYLEETADCVRNSSHIEIHGQNFYTGCDSFKELITRNHVFIDKSLLLRDIFKDHSYLTIFYLPPKFSKTTNLEMIRFFAEFQLYSNHSIIPYKHTTAYNFFTSGKLLEENGTVKGQLLHPPLISRHVELIDQHIAQHPAIYFNFTMLRCIDFACSWGGIRDYIGREFKRYGFLTSRISPNESSQYMQLVEYFNRTEWTFKPDFAVDLPHAAIFLAKLVSNFFQKKPILYIDEYDSMLGMFLHGRYYNDQESEKALTFFSQFIDAVLTRDDIWHRIILTGTHGIHSNIISSMEGSKSIYTAFDNHLSHFFGFTESDVTTMAKHYTSVTAEKVQQMREYYNGYQMGRAYPIYSPGSIMNFFTTRELIHDWGCQTQYRWFLYNLWGITQMRHLWLDLLSDRADYLARPFEKFSHDDLWTLRNTLAISINYPSYHSFSLSSKEFTQVVMYQVDIGYLTWANYDISDRDTTFNIRVANLDIKKAVFKDMSLGYKKYLNVPQADKATAALDSYLFSHQREKSIDILTQSFDKLFNQIKEIPEIDASVIDLQTDPTGRRIIEYIGLSLRYQHDHKLDRNIADGFIASKLNVSSVVIFNYNRSVENDHILNQIDNFTHPWTELGPEMTNSSVTYVVIGMKNGAEISIRRYGAEPPIPPTTTTAPTTQKKKKGSKGPWTTKKNENKEGGGSKSKGKKIPQTTRVRQSPKTKKSKSGSQFKPQVTKALNSSLTNEAMVTTKDEGIRMDDTAGFRTPHGSKSTSQFELDVSNFLNESSTVEKTLTKGDRTAKNMEIQTHDLAKNHSENNFTAGSTESNPTYASSSNPSQPSLKTEGISSGSKFSPLVTKSLEDLLTNQATLTQFNNESGISEPMKDHIDRTDSTGSKLTNTTTAGLIEPSNGSKSSPEFTLAVIKSFNNSIVDETFATSTSQGSILTSELTSAVTKSLNHSFINEISITQTEIIAKKSTDVHTSPYSAKSTQGYAENTSFSTLAFAESSLNEITRVTRSVTVDQFSSTQITSGKSASGSKSNSKITKSLKKSFKNDKVTDSGTTSISSDLTKITSYISSTNKNSKSGSEINQEITKISSKSLTNEIKVTDSAATKSSTAKIKVTDSAATKSSTAEIKVTDSAATKSSTAKIKVTDSAATKSSTAKIKVTDSAATKSSTAKIKVTDSAATKSSTAEIKVTDSAATKSSTAKIKVTDSAATKSSTAEIKVTNPKTPVHEKPSATANQKSPSNTLTASKSSQKVSKSSKKSIQDGTEITIADTAAIESTTAVQPSSSNVPPASALTSQITKFPKKSSTTSIKDAATSETQTNPSDLTSVKTKQSKSGSKSNTKLKVTRANDGSTFTKRKKGKNFNATAFVRGNFTKFTKFSKGQQSFVKKTTITTTPSTTTESTTTEMPFFPSARSTRLRYVRRSRTGSKMLPKTTTISAMQFWKLMLHIH